MTDPPDRFVDYLAAVAESSGRVNKVGISLLIVTALAAVSLLSTLENSWIAKRISAARNIRSPYLAQYIGPPPPASTSSEWELYKIRYASFYGALAKAHVDALTAQKTPLPGTQSVDINYVGAVFGPAFLIVIIALIITMDAEGQNLDSAFSYASSRGALAEMYELAAMRQFVRQAGDVKGNAWSNLGRRTMSAMFVAPVLVFGAMVWHDGQTIGMGPAALFDSQIIFALLMELVCLSILNLLTVLAIRARARTNAVWARWSPPGRRRCEDRPSPLVK